MLRYLRFASVLGMALLGWGAGAQQRLALRGTVVTPAGPVDGATVLIEGERIVAVGVGVDVPAGTRVVETHGIVYPGLIDLHNHVTWNALPRWSAGQKSGARYDWQQLPEYGIALNVPHKQMVAEGHGCAAERYAEAKAVIGGATAQAGLSVADLGPSTAPPANCLAGMVRELGVRSRLYPAGAAERLRYEVFPLALDGAHASALVEGLAGGQTDAALFHLAEGAAENASARREFGMLKARGLLVRGVSLIHGVALTPANFAEMAAAHVGLVWSPHSNFELYGSTANVAAAKAAGVTIALAPDWSPTGSDGMLQELKYAATWNATQESPPFSDRELFDMVTLRAAELGGIAGETGSLAAGMRADLLVLTPSGAAPANDAYGALVHGSLGEVGLVMVGGAAVYGDPRMVKQVEQRSAGATITVCGQAKELVMASPALWNATVSELGVGLGRWGAALSTLGACF